MIAAFCGHSHVARTTEIEHWLTATVTQLIEEGATQFYMGGYGDFDHIAFGVVRKLKRVHSHIEIIYVQAYLDRTPWNADQYDDTTYPPIENGPPRFAISRRNKWLANEVDVIVAYVFPNRSGGAATMLNYAKKANKRIIAFPFERQSEIGGLSHD